MSHSTGYSRFGTRYQARVHSIRPPDGRPSAYWCDVIDTPWSSTMRNQTVGATLVCGPGVPRTWRFYSQIHNVK